MSKNNKKLVPKLRFPEFRDAKEWIVRPLGKVSKISTGSSNREDSTTGSGAYTFFDRSQDIRTSNIYLFDGEAVIVAGEGQEFAPKYFIGKFDLHQRTYAIMDFQSCSGLYLFYYIYQFRIYFLTQAVGSTVKSLRLPMFQNMPIGLPSPKEQQKIAECLSSIDDLISAQSQKVEALKTHKKGLMQQLFPREGETIPRLRFSEFRETEEWEASTLGDIATIKSGSTPLRSNLEFFEGGSIPWVKTTDLNNSFIFTTEECITPKAKARINPEDSILVAMYGGFNQIGRTGYLKVPAATNQALSVLNTDSDKVIPMYLLIWLNAKVENWKKIASSSRKDPNITGSDVSGFPIIFPMEKSEQQKIADCLSSIDNLISAQSQKLDALKTHKKGLMQQLFPSTEADNE